VTEMIIRLERGDEIVMKQRNCNYCERLESSWNCSKKVATYFTL
jgi:hypothetical protein